MEASLGLASRVDVLCTCIGGTHEVGRTDEGGRGEVESLPVLLRPCRDIGHTLRERLAERLKRVRVDQMGN